MKFNDYLNESLEKDSELKKEYDALQPEYEIISKIIEARVARGMTQGELAKRCGIKQSNISRLESGKANPTIGFLEKIAEAMDTELHIEFRAKI